MTRRVFSGDLFADPAAQEDAFRERPASGFAPTGVGRGPESGPENGWENGWENDWETGPEIASAIDFRTDFGAPAAPGQRPDPALEPVFEPIGEQVDGKPHYTDHRTRLRARFLQAGPESLADYEMLELVLFRAIARRDVKPLAKQLLAMFGDFNHVISAPPARLMEVKGVGAAVAQELKIVEAAAHRLAQSRVMGRDALSSWDALVTYCRQRLAHEMNEQFRVLFLDRKNILIADEAQQKGTVDHVPVYPREVVRRALELNASALILVHNHPSGDPSPSQADIDMTRRILRACDAMGVTVHDHIIIGKDDVASFHAMGLLG